MLCAPAQAPPSPQKQGSVWKPEIRVPSGSDYVLLSGLDWNTDYEVVVVAENQRGKSLPGVLSFRTAAEPTSVPGTHPQSRVRVTGEEGGEGGQLLLRMVI